MPSGGSRSSDGERMALVWALSPTIMHLEDDVGPAGHHTAG
ncbi:MAG TPA: hypothetical protein VM366_00445 [Anaerolineae bacterium]|nr:hypothetical protein [Anaerolineae bacterium]